MKPAANIVAGWATAVNDLVMTATATKIACPTALARLLKMHVSISQPVTLTLAVDTGCQRSHRTGFISDESVTGEQFTVASIKPSQVSSR
jgi:hypothetical protein